MSRLWHRIRSSEWARHGLVLFAAVVFTNASAVVFHVVMTRLLPPDQYGALGALLAAFSILSVPVGAAQAVVAKRVSALRARGNEAEAAGFVSWTLRRLGLVSIGAAVVGTAASPLIARFLHFGSQLTGVLLVLLIVLNFAPPVASGGLQGFRNFRPIGLSFFVGGSLRLCFGVVLVKLGWGVNGAALAYVVDAAAELLITVVPLHRAVSVSQPSQLSAMAPLWREVRRATLAIGGVSSLTGVNLLLVRHYFPSSLSGFYAAAWTLARAVLFLPLAIQLMAFPQFAELSGRGPLARRALAWSTALTGLMGFAVTGCMVLFGSSITTALFGDPYSRAASVATVLTLGMALHAMTVMVMYFHLASESAAFLSVFPAIGLEALTIVLFHRTILQVSWIVAATEAGLFALYLLLALRSARHAVPPLDFRSRRLGG